MPTPNIKRFFPSLQDLVNLDLVPNSLDFLKQAISSLLANSYYKDFPH
jgi:hypothetical protein